MRYLISILKRMARWVLKLRRRHQQIGPHSKRLVSMLQTKLAIKA